MGETDIPAKRVVKLRLKTSIPKLNQTLLRMGKANNFVSEPRLIGGLGHFTAADLGI